MGHLATRQKRHHGRLQKLHGAFLDLPPDRDFCKHWFERGWHGKKQRRKRRSLCLLFSHSLFLLLHDDVLIDDLVGEWKPRKVQHVDVSAFCAHKQLLVVPTQATCWHGLQPDKWKIYLAKTVCIYMSLLASLWTGDNKQTSLFHKLT